MKYYLLINEGSNNLENPGVFAQFHCLLQKTVGTKIFYQNFYDMLCKKRGNLSVPNKSKIICSDYEGGEGK